MPPDALPEMEGVRAGVRVEIPGFGQAGDDLIFPIVRGKAIEEQEIDFTVFVQGGIDPGIITAGVNEGGRVFINVLFRVSSAGGKTEQKREGGQYGNDTRHSEAFLSFPKYGIQKRKHTAPL